MSSRVGSTQPRRWIRGSRGLVVLCVGMVLGCSLATGFDGFTGVTPKRPPPKRDAGGGDGPLRLAAARAIRFGSRDAKVRFGYDIDNQCTCPDVSSCRNPDARDAGICDNGGVCIDNQVESYQVALGQALLGSAEGASATSSLARVTDSVNENLRIGKHGILVEIGGWNGQPNDDEITFSIMNVTDVNGGGFLDREKKNDFAVDPASLPGGEPAVVTGYVAGNIVVARGFSFDFALQMDVPRDGEDPPSFTVRVQANLRNALFVGTFVEQTENTFVMNDATLTGALPIELVQRQLLALTLCPGDTASGVDAFKELCASRDLSFTAPGDLEAGCDAISFAMQLDLSGASRNAGVLEPEALLPIPPARFTCGSEPPGCP